MEMKSAYLQEANRHHVLRLNSARFGPILGHVARVYSKVQRAVPRGVAVHLRVQFSLPSSITITSGQPMNSSYLSDPRRGYLKVSGSFGWILRLSLPDTREKKKERGA